MRVFFRMKYCFHATFEVDMEIYLAPYIFCYEVLRFQMAVWLCNKVCQLRRGWGSERNDKEVAAVLAIQCYFHLAPFY